VLLGLIELIIGGTLADHLGLSGFAWLIRLYGAREIVNGALILASKDPTPWVWLRVIGDGLDVATLVWGLSRDPSHWIGVLVAFIAVAPVVLADIYCAMTLSGESKEPLPAVYDYRNRSGFPQIRFSGSSHNAQIS
jgi:hypothetical protein